MADPMTPIDPGDGGTASGSTPPVDSPAAKTAPELPLKLMSAGAPGWYSLVATSFLICEFNPLGAIGMAAGVHSIGGGAPGWALTAGSFMLALSGFIYAGRRASLERNKRALEIASIIAIAAGVIPCLSAVSIPALIAWPIGMMFLVTGGSGLRASRRLADTPADVAAAPESEQIAPAAEPRADTAAGDKASMTERAPKRRRRRRRSRNRKRRTPPG
jgi:hypothetical protein